MIELENSSPRILSFIEAQPKFMVAITAFAIMTALGYIDYTTGFEAAFSLFYIIPIALAAWRIGGPGGVFFAILSAITWRLANSLAGEISSSFIAVWNTSMRAGIFLIVGGLVSEFRRLLDIERRLARTDFLTGALNSRAFYDIAQVEIARARRYRHPLTVAYMDIDGFKVVNDKYGHSIGDQALQQVIRTIRANTREIDSIARIGGDEFILLLPETDKKQAHVVIPRLQRILMDELNSNQWGITFSIGVITYKRPPENIDALIKDTDQYMYKVKHSKKNGIKFGSR